MYDPKLGNTNLPIAKMEIIWPFVLLLFAAVKSVEGQQCDFPETVDYLDHRVMPNRSVNGAITYFCKEGYWYNGTNPRRCQANLKWSGEPGICKEVRCPEPRDPPHGSVKYKGLGYNYTAKVECEYGYRYSHPQFNPRRCQGNNTWTFDGGLCEELHCDDLPVPKDGRITYIGRTLNASAELSCREGYAYRAAEWTCQSDKKWSLNFDKQCEVIRCATQPEIENGEVRMIEGNLFGMNATIQCNPGFHLDGEDLMSCQADGMWSKPGNCSSISESKTSNEHLAWLVLLIPVCVVAGVLAYRHFRDSSEESNVMDHEMAIPLVNTPNPVSTQEKVIHFSFKLKTDINIDGHINEVLSETEIMQKVKTAVEKNMEWTFNAAVKCVSKSKQMVFMSIKGMIEESDIQNALIDSMDDIGIVPGTLLFRGSLSTDLAIEVVKSGSIKSTDFDIKVDIETGFVQHKVSPCLTQEPTELPHVYQAKLQDKETGEIIEHVLSADDAKQKCVVISGRAGIGKTTLMQRLMWRWAHGEWATHLKAIFLLNVRVLVAMREKAELPYILSQCAMYKAPDFQFEVDGKWLRHNEEHIGIILDGIDEISAFEEKWMSISTDRIEDTWASAEPVNLIFLLLKRCCLSAAFLIVTSRPFKGLAILKPQRTVEVLGLTEQRVKEYVDKNVTSEANNDEVKKALIERPILLSLSSITFFCAALCQLLEKNISATVTLTTYTQIIVYLMEEYICRSKKVKHEELVLKEMSELLKLLCNLAYVGLKKRAKEGVAQLVFHKQELLEQNLNQEGVEEAKRAGLFIQNDADRSESGQFVHMYIQELLAMAWLLTQPKALKEALPMLSGQLSGKATKGNPCNSRASSLNELTSDPISSTSTRSTSGHFQRALLFLYGLGFSSSESAERLHEALTGSKNFGSDVQGILQTEVEHITDELLVIQMLYESQSPNLAAHVGKCRFHDKVILQNVKLTSFDMLALIFLLTHHSSARSIVLREVGLDSVSIRKIAEFLKSNTTITSIKLKDSGIDDECMKLLSDGLQSNRTLKTLVLPWTQLTDIGATALLRALGSNTVVTVKVDEVNCSTEIGQQISTQERIVCLDESY